MGLAGHRQWLTTLRGTKRDAQISSVRLASGHRNSLKLLQSVNLHSVRNSLKQLNYREMRELANPLNRLDCNQCFCARHDCVADSFLLNGTKEGINLIKTYHSACLNWCDGVSFLPGLVAIGFDQIRDEL